MLRNDPLFSFKNGDHTCVFFSDTAHLLDVLTPYIAEGLRRNERCFCAQTQATLVALSHDLRFLGVDIERETKHGTLEFHTINDVYFPNRHFEPEALIELLDRSIEDSVRSGFAGFRTAGELSWAIEGRDECDRLIQYEKLVEAAYANRQAVGMCMYPTRGFSPDVLQQVVRSHSKVLTDSGPSYASLCIQRTDCEAEIVTDKTNASLHRAYDYVVRLENREYLWGKSPNFEGAVTTVEQLMSSRCTVEHKALV